MWRWPKLALNWEARNITLVLLFFFLELQWIKRKYLLPLPSSDKQVKAGRNEGIFAYGNGVSFLHAFWNLVHDSICWPLISRHWMFQDIVKVAGIDVLNLQMLMLKHPGLFSFRPVWLKQHSQVDNLWFLFWRWLWQMVLELKWPWRALMSTGFLKSTEM